MRALFTTIVLSCISLVPVKAHAWSAFIHELICEMAFQELSPTVQREISILSLNQQAVSGVRTFPKSCEWADVVRSSTHRETYEYHFMSVPRAAQSIDFIRDCVAHDCVTQAVVRYATYFSNDLMIEEDRVEALRFLGHFVADLHQPLHVGFVEDLGGSMLFVQIAPGQITVSLHSFWDAVISKIAVLDATETTDSVHVDAVRAISTELLRQISAQDRIDWTTGSVNAWAEESYNLATSCAYRVDCGEALKFLSNGEVLSNDYWTATRPIVLERIQQAAVRLAWIIEAAVGGTLDIDALAN